MKATLLRRLVHRVGLECFSYDAEQETPDFDVDSEATDAFFRQVLKARAAKTKNYFDSEGMMHELGVYAICLECCDSTLLYPLLGDPIKDPKVPSKLDLLLDKDSSLVGECFASLLKLLVSWQNGGPNRQPWALLDALKAPVGEEPFQRWVRSQVLRLNSAFFRRYESRLACWPYKLYPLASPKFDHEAKLRVAEDLLKAPVEMLDTYSRGIRTLFGDVEKLTSFACHMTLASDFRSHAYGIDFVERLNSELTAGHCRRGPSRNMTNAARESIVAQLGAVHRHHGGRDPLAPGSLVNGAQEEAIRCMPLLAGGSCMLPGSSAQPARPLGAHGPSALEDVCESAESRPASSHAGSGQPHQQRNFEEEVLVRRQNPALMAPSESQPREEHTRRGLSSYLYEKNKYLQAAKEAKGNQRLTQDEVTELSTTFKTLWNEMADRDVYLEAYQEWRRSPLQVKQTKPPDYRPVWGGGCHATPITKEELHQFIEQEGWPKDEDVNDKSMAEVRVEADTGVDFEMCSGYNLWGIGRQARNVDRSRTRCPGAFPVIEKGLFNFIAMLGREAADAGGIMLMVAGPSLEEGHFFRSVCLLTGTCYNPQVWDATCLEFEQVGDEASEQLTLPCHVKIATRPCLANASFTAIGTQTSDEWISNLVEKLGAMQLHKVVYEVICPDGTLLWSRITALEDMGELWAPGMTTPLAFSKPGGGGGAGSEHKKRQGIFKGMSGKDPFSEGAAKDLAARSRRGRGKGRGGAAGSRARERSAPLPPGGPSDALAIEDVHMEDAADLAAADGPPPGPPGAPHLDEVDMDLADILDDASSIQSVEELEAAFAEPRPEGATDDADVFFDVGNSASGLEAQDPETAVAVLHGVDAVARDIGLEDALPAGSSSSSTDPVRVHEPVIAVEPPPQPWERLGEVSAYGYVYDGARSVMRVQRGKPARSVSVSCYLHPACTLLLTQALCPSDAVLKQWLFEVEAAPPGAPSAERKELARQHMALGRARWSARANRGVPKA